MPEYTLPEGVNYGRYRSGDTVPNLDPETIEIMEQHRLAIQTELAKKGEQSEEFRETEVSNVGDEEIVLRVCPPEIKYKHYKTGDVMELTGVDLKAFERMLGKKLALPTENSRVAEAPEPDGDRPERPAQRRIKVPEKTSTNIQA